ncbi:hypothetical protein GBF38_010508 [Nibea albiflora]|uniref:Uncharacterized protein n=1 Tax=Nibea albiflora TaxID=240163 RepID=A0ACB7F3X7_NIBAL|nr:hypothetical protein GBF38_010508 [Nibea albiflora]
MVLQGVPMIPGDLAGTLESTQIRLECDPCFLSRLWVSYDGTVMVSRDPSRTSRSGTDALQPASRNHDPMTDKRLSRVCLESLHPLRNGVENGGFAWAVNQSLKYVELCAG